MPESKKQSIISCNMSILTLFPLEMIPQLICPIEKIPQSAGFQSSRVVLDFDLSSVRHGESDVLFSVHRHMVHQRCPKVVLELADRFRQSLHSRDKLGDPPLPHVFRFAACENTCVCVKFSRFVSIGLRRKGSSTLTSYYVGIPS